MSLFNYQSQKQHSSKHHKKRLTKDQVRLLEISFGSNKKLEPERKLQLARDLGIPPRQIAIWYQNKRARWKTQSLELDHSALQLRLEAATAEKKQLEKEVERLREELEKAHKVLVSLRQFSNPPPPMDVSSLSSCCDERGSSSLHDQDHVMSCSWVDNNNEALQLEDLYACLMGANCSTTCA
ncbi:homeobox-leucine zipper protein ATHB-52 [Rhododendron vialii]|uniref:homeobox-leucine zipper protein ATHB-52 n=1 Tax=Rhododendron vialii TaxID=182163 RepID=UPI00265E13C0|nr:homeobox-leucine zipper protein ATHB-52 [Rhododendron vialii]